MEDPNLLDDEALVRRTQNGDTQAFDALWLKYSSRIYSLIYNMTSNHEDANDLLLEVFASVHNDKEFIELTASNTPTREVDLSELQQRLNEALMKLSLEHRTVVTMFDIQGMPHAEIARILGVPEATVRSRLFYAHRQLQNYLEEFRKK